MSANGKSASSPRGIAVILLGPPGSGKGTQARHLSQSFGLLHLSTGDMLRGAAMKDSELGERVRAKMNAGQLVPDELICRIVAERLTSDGIARGVVLDGFPRTLGQARFLFALLAEQKTIALNMQVSRDLLIQRIMGRLTCPACGEIYNLFFKPPRSAGRCDCDGSELGRRTDDTEIAIRERLISYEKETRPLIEHFRKVNILIDVQGELEPAALRTVFHEQVRAVLEFGGAAVEEGATKIITG
jgi:adenylate kinase